METKPENIPNHLFDWLENRSFNSLSEFEKAEVLIHFSKDEFEDLQRVAMAVKHPGQLAGESQRENPKSKLLGRFGEVHAKQIGNVKPLFSYMPIWRAAAIALLLICFGLTYRILHSPLSKPAETAMKVDTLYLVKQIASAPVKIFDTLYISKTTRTPKNNDGIKSIAGIENPQSQPNAISIENDLAVVSLSELENTANQPKRNSLKDDSVLRKFAVVRM